MKHKWRLDENGKPDEWAWESGFHNGVYCECCGKTVCIHCDPDWELMDDCPGDTRKPKTNADRIRAMTDEELAKMLDAFTEYFTECNRSTADVNCEDCELFEVCSLGEGKALNWLQQPAKED